MFSQKLSAVTPTSSSKTPAAITTYIKIKISFAISEAGGSKAAEGLHSSLQMSYIAHVSLQETAVITICLVAVCLVCL